MKRKSAKQIQGLKHLGSVETKYGFDYNPGLLESFLNRHPKKEAWTTFLCTEFTSLCPKTGQPDFARITVNYIADKDMIESKSLKLYLFSFRNHADFHENCVQTICDDLAKLITPKYLEVIGEFNPRGGIAIYAFASVSNKENAAFRQERMRNFSPGKYTMDFSRIY